MLEIYEEIKKLETLSDEITEYFDYKHNQNKKRMLDTIRNNIEKVIKNIKPEEFIKEDSYLKGRLIDYRMEIECDIDGIMYLSNEELDKKRAKYWEEEIRNYKI